MYPTELDQWQKRLHEFTPFKRIYAYYRAETHWVYFKTPYWGDFVSCVSHIGMWDGKLWGVSWSSLPQVLGSIRKQNLLQCQRASVIFYELETSVALGKTAVFAAANRERTRFHSYPSPAARFLFGFDRTLTAGAVFRSAILYNNSSCRSILPLMEVTVESDLFSVQKIALTGDPIDVRFLGELGNVGVAMFELENATTHSLRGDLNFNSVDSPVVDNQEMAGTSSRRRGLVRRIL